MLLLLLLTSTLNGDVSFFLSDASKYKYNQDKFYTDDPRLSCMIKNYENHKVRRFFAKNTLYGTIFSRHSIISNPKLKEEAVVLEGLRPDGKEVFLTLSLPRNSFKQYLENIDNDPALIINSSIYVKSGKINGRSVREIFFASKDRMGFTPENPNNILEKTCLRMNFRNEENIIYDCYYAAFSVKQLSL